MRYVFQELQLRAWIRPRFRAFQGALLGTGCVLLIAGAWSAFGAWKEAGGQQSATAGSSQAQRDSSPGEVRPQPSTLEIEQIVLVDRRGRKRIRLVGDDGGPAITLFDGSGKKRLELRIGDEAPTVALLDAKENELATVQLAGDQASLLMGGRQRDQEPSVSLESGPQRKPGLYLRDRTGAPVASLTNEGNSEASLRLESGKRGTSVRPDGLFVQDSRGLNRAMLRR
jgi:hypothetical protein